MTSDMPFRAVCATIRDYAFRVSNLPLIVSIEVHANHQQQQVMVDLMQEYFQGMLIGPLGPEHDYNSINLPTLQELEGKILVKVKRAHAKPVVAEAQSNAPQAPPPSMQRTTSADSTASKDTESDERPDGKKAAPKPKLIEDLSKLGVYFG